MNFCVQVILFLRQHYDSSSHKPQHYIRTIHTDIQEAIEWRATVLSVARQENNLAAIVSFEDKDLSEEMRKRIRKYMQNYSFMYRRPEFLATTCFGTKEERPVLSCT